MIKGVGLVGEVEIYKPCEDHIMDFLLEGKCRTCKKNMPNLGKPEDFIIHEDNNSDEQAD